MPKLRAQQDAELDVLIARLDKYFNQLDNVGTELSTVGEQNLALRRRLSREAGAYSRIVELGAIAFNLAIEHITCSGIVLRNIDRLDTGTLVLLTRASVRRAGDCKPVIWWSNAASKPQNTPSGNARAVAFDRALAASGIEVVGDAANVISSPILAGSCTFVDASVALLQHNYARATEVCLRLAMDAETDQLARLNVVLGLAQTSNGLINDAAESFEAAITGAQSPQIAAHACYLRALLATKRVGDLALSNNYLDRGHLLLRGLHEATDQLEAAWLLNGRALNLATLFKRAQSMDLWMKALQLETEAFNLIKSISNDEGAYLRYNLLANTSMLYMMHPDLNVRREGAEQFSRAFIGTDPQSEIDAVTLLYRRALCYLSSNRLDEALRLLQTISLGAVFSEDWPLREHVLYAIGYLYHRLGKSQASVSYLEMAAIISTEGRSRRTLLRALRAILAANNGTPTSIARSIIDAEAIDIADIPPTFAQPSPKLPAYYPEIDLEDLPPFDVNRFLGSF